MTSNHSSEIVACGYAYPSLLVDNTSYVSRCQFTPTGDWEQLLAASGIETRRWCADSENTRTLAEAAVANLFETNAAAVDDVDVIVVASGTTMPMAHPSDPDNRSYADLSPLIARQLGRSRALCLDIKACYCTGFLRGMQVTDALLANPNYRTALLVAVEQGSRFATAPSNRTSFCGIVADAAGAVLFRRTAPAPNVGVIDHCGYTDVDKLGWVGIGEDAASIIMLGSRAAEATVRMLVECGRTLLARNGLSADEVDWLLPIQSHAALIHEVCDALGFPRSKLLWFADRNGFSGSASIPSTLAEQTRNGNVVKGARVLSLAVGAGMNCGGALYFS